MFTDNFDLCFNDFLQNGCESFFRNSRTSLQPNTTLLSRRNSIPTSPSSRMNDWSVAHSMGRVSQDNTPVHINHNRLQWFDSYSIRSLAPSPKQPARTVYLTKEELAQIKSEVYFKESENEENLCDICLEKFKTGARLKVLPCKHRYHSHCVEQWLKQRPVCPRCRAGVRAGLRKMKKQQNSKETKSATKVNDKQIEKQLKLKNEYYLKLRKKRLEAKQSENSKNSQEKKIPKVSVNVSKCEEKGNIKENEEYGKNIENEDMNNEQMNEARVNAVAAALKRLALTNKNKK